MADPLSLAFDVPFDEALEWAKGRVSVLPDEYYNTLPAQARSRAFTISGLASLDQVQGALDDLTQALANGDTFAEWKKRQTAELLALGKGRLDNIFRTAIQTHYNVGHYQQQQANKARRPFMMYDAINDSRVRENHRALDGFIAPADDPIWDKIYPPNGYRCRCGVISLSEKQARQRGWEGVTKYRLDGVADEGWDYNPAKGQDEALSNVVAGKLRQCEAFTFAKGRIGKPVWCDDGKAQDYARMIDAWASRRGAMPGPRPLVLNQLSYTTPQNAFEQFMSAFSDDSLTVRVMVPWSDTVIVSDDLFLNLDGDWKIAKRGRDKWLMYLAELIKSPQEGWRLQLSGSQELYLLGRFQRGSERLDALAVFERESDSGVWLGKTAFVSDRKKYLMDKRAELLKNERCCLRWVEV